ncbi:MAG: hypothetical protein KJP16_12845 [Gammaproteobacteria bacterium]|nr:hypothetical protein [Gammaproteobacteria bacterium]NNL51692.1 hypothetical protein [Woeseiaceae bacterium]
MTGDFKRIDVTASAAGPVKAAQDGAKFDVKATWRAVKAAVIAFTRGGNIATTAAPVILSKEDAELLQDVTQSNLYMRFPHG